MKTDTRVLFPCHQTWAVYKESKEIILSLEQRELLCVFDAVPLQSLGLSTKEWRALPKEERDNYTKQTASKDYVECVSYTKVWGETRKAKSEYLSQLHTDYHNEVGRKYGLARGIPYNELSEEEKRGQGIRTRWFLKPSDR